MSNSKLAAIAAHDAATAAPGSADWRSVADMLRACLTIPKARAKAGAVPSAWVHYKAGAKAVFSTLAVTFADGRTITATAATNPGKPVNVGQAVLAAVAFYRRRIYGALGYVQPSQFSVTLAPWDAAIAVPTITDVRCEADDSVFDAEACTAATVDARAGTFVLADAEREAEFYSGARRDEMRAAFPEFGAYGMLRRSDIPAALYARAWRAAYLPAELASRAAHNASRAAHDARTLAARNDAMCETLAGWLDDMAPRYGAPPPFELSGTFDAPAPISATVEAVPGDRAPDPVPPPPAAPRARPAPAGTDASGKPARRKPTSKRGGGSGGGGGAPVVETAAPTPVEAIPPVPPVEAIADPVEAIDFEPVPSTFCEEMPQWEPDAESHPVIAHCHSPKAREALFGRIMDGTFPANGAQGKAGSFRITYADAVACEGLPSIRLTGMPRKAYTRRAASVPSVAPAPRAAFHIPAGAFSPPGGMPGGSVTLHAPSI